MSDAVRQQRERRALTPQAALGRKGEDLAHRYLQRCGYRVIARNYKPGADSEIDIVAREEHALIFVEVKSRLSSEFSAPERAIDAEKQKRIVKAARSFVARSGDAWSNVRFDTITVVFTNPPSISHYKDVFFYGRALEPSKSINRG